MFEADAGSNSMHAEHPARASRATTHKGAVPIELVPFADAPISLVDTDGQWCGDWQPQIEPDTFITLYHKLVAARALDTRLGLLQRSGRISFVAPAAGHEGAQVGIAHAMRPGHDWLFPYYRDSAMALALGMAPAELFAQHMATRADTAKARQMPCHPGSRDLHIYTAVSSIAGQVPPAVGMAMAAQLRGSDEVSVTTFGDGATSEGDWYAALNMASARKAPMLFACENNRYAISVPYATQTASPSICEKARACGLPGYRVDGMDVVSVYCVMQTLLQRIRAGDGPALVEFDVYRYGPHSSADDDSVYRSREEVEAAKKRDPIDRMRRFLERQGLWDDDREERLKADIKAEFDAAIKQAEAAGKQLPDAMFDDVYAERPWHLSQQAAIVAGEL